MRWSDAGHGAAGDRRRDATDTAPPGLPAPHLTFVVPVLDEADGIGSTLTALAPLRARGHQVVVVDGGSRDATVAIATPLADAVVAGPRGRARQMNAGAAVASGDAIVFVHADTLLPPDADALVVAALAGGTAWGRFDVTIVGDSAWLPVVAAAMNRRSRWTSIATGDQAIFVATTVFRELGGYADQPLMEDIELSRRLRRIGRPACLRAKVRTSGRRWTTRGVWPTIRLMWRLRWRYWRGADPEQLARAYR